MILGDAAALILKICLKKLQKFTHGWAQRQKCYATLAPNKFQAMLIYHLELHILPKVSKTVGILAKKRIIKMYFEYKFEPKKKLIGQF